MLNKELKCVLSTDSIYTQFGKASKGKGAPILCICALGLLVVIGCLSYVISHFIPKSIFDEINSYVVLLTVIASIRIYGKDIRAKLSLISIQHRKNHVVICGLGEKGAQLASELIKDNHVAVIDSNPSNPAISGCQDKGIVVITGDARDLDILDQANAGSARLLFAVSSAGGINIEIAHSAQRLIRHSGGVGGDTGLRCHVHVGSQSTRETFSHHDLFRKTHEGFDASIFNIYDSAARYIFERFPPDAWARRQGARKDIGIMIIGFSAMGEAIVKQGTRVGHYLDWPQLQMSVVDEDVAKPGRRFMGTYGATFPASNIVPDISLRFVDCDPSLITTKFDMLGADGGLPNIIYITLNDDAEAISLAIKIRCALESNEIPIVICLNSSLSSMTDEFILTENRNIHSFNELSYACSWPILVDNLTDSLAKLIHSSYVCSVIEFKESDFVEIDIQALVDSICRDLPEYSARFEGAAPLAALNSLLGEPDLSERVRSLIKKDVPVVVPSGPLSPCMGDKERTLRTNATLLARLYPGKCPDKQSALNSLTTWENLTEDKKDSNRWQADHLSVKLRAIGWSPCGENVAETDGSCPCGNDFKKERERILALLDEALSDDRLLEALSEVEHRRWVAALLIDGWKYAPGRKDSLLKTHPLLVPYVDIDQQEKEKDTVMIHGIRKLVDSEEWLMLQEHHCRVC